MDLSELERALKGLSHGDEALQLVRSFAQKLPRGQRALAFRDLAVPPIDYADALAKGALPLGEDPFVLLQGDIIQTDSAYHQGERQVSQLHLIANATCDLVPGRREFAVLLPVIPLHRNQPKTGELLGELLSFRSNRRMYLPPLTEDPSVVGSAIEFDRLANVRLDALLVAHRVASLSLVGWRVLGSHLRAFFTRTGASEATLRAAYASRTALTQASSRL